jgi:hypothetical protein
VTAEQIISLLSTQGLALVLVLGGAIWTVRVLVPRYFDGIKRALDRQTECIDDQTKAIEVLSALISPEQTAAEFERKLALVRALRQKANGYK